MPLATLFGLSATLHLYVGVRIVHALPGAAAATFALLLVASTIFIPMGLVARRFMLGFTIVQLSDIHVGLTIRHVKILLAHQPRSAFAAARAGFDLQLSGHTHGGQFLPWTYFVKLQQPFTAGLHRVGQPRVYVSCGTGYWGPPKRIGAPSEITLVKLTAGQPR